MAEFPIDEEESLKEYANERAEQLLRRLVDDWVRILRGHIDAAEKHYRYYYGVAVQLTTQMFIEGDTVKMIVEARIPPEVQEQLRKIVEREVVKSAGDTRIRLQALRNILLKELRSSSGGLNALLSSHRESTREGLNQTGGSGEEVRDQEGGHNVKGDNESTI